jgi:glycosyltransferase involved in cell wall biosynthesis
VRYLNYVPEADLPALTAGAEAFVYPSLYEGFGIPVVQAMATGCPVITSNVSCLPEITGPAALLVDPRSVSELTCAIRSVLESATLRQRLRTASLAQGAQYTWQATAEQSLKFFESVQ